DRIFEPGARRFGHAIEEAFADDADTHALDVPVEPGSEVGDGPAGGVDVGRGVARNDAQDRRGIPGAARDRAEVVEAEAVLRTTRLRNAPEGWLQAGDAAVGRGTTNAPAGVGSEAAEEKPRGDTTAGASARTARVVL